VKRTLNGVTTYYVYDGEKPILEYSSTGGLAGWNVYGKGIDEILQRIAYGNYFFQQDREGSVTHLTDPSGNVIEKYRYDAFGAPTFYNGSGTQISSTAYNNRFLFTGREYAATYYSTYVPTFKFYEYRARAYHPGLGRFMSEDPKLFEPGDYNLFRYCHNDPIDMTDPMGLESPSWVQAIIPGKIEWDAAVANFQAGNYGTAAAAFTAMLGQQIAAVYTVGGSMRAQQSFQAARVATAEQQAGNKVAAVIGKFSNSPNYLEVAEKIGAKKFNIPQHVWEKMSESQRWAANQKFLDRAIARGGDFILDKPIKDIGSVSGELRKELNYLGQRGYQLSGDGSRMIDERAAAEAAKRAGEVNSAVEHTAPVTLPR
jgi:RHS repeat-associated protein